MRLIMQSTPQQIINGLPVVRPTGDHSIDTKREENLDELIELTNRLLFVIDDLRQYQKSHCQSEKQIGQKAAEFMQDVHDSFEI